MMYQVWRVEMTAGKADFVKWFNNYDEADAFADMHDDGNIQYVVLEEDEEFYFL